VVVLYWALKARLGEVVELVDTYRTVILLVEDLMGTMFSDEQ